MSTYGNQDLINYFWSGDCSNDPFWMLIPPPQSFIFHQYFFLCPPLFLKYVRSEVYSFRVTFFQSFIFHHYFFLCPSIFLNKYVGSSGAVYSFRVISLPVWHSNFNVVKIKTIYLRRMKYSFFSKLNNIV